jgi:AAA15 family ATPase/GTPase
MAIFISSLNVEGFRGIRNLSVSDLNHVNIIAGDNNSGKTSLLESILLLKNPNDFNNVVRVSRMRDFFRLDSAFAYENFKSLFPNNSFQQKMLVSGICNGEQASLSLTGQQKTIMLTPENMFRNLPPSAREIRLKQYSGNMEAVVFSGKFESAVGGKIYSKEVSYSVHNEISGREVSENNYIDMVYTSPSEHLRSDVFSRIIRDEAYKEICINILKQFDNDIVDILYINNEDTNRPVEYVKHDVLGNMPLSTYGDGIKKVLSLANSIARSTNGVLLIDELETAIHSKYYDDIFRFVVKACKQFDVQLFVTTHNIEAIDGLLATQDYGINQSDDISVITFMKDSVSKNTLSRVLPGRVVHKNRDEFGFEVRL